MQVSKLLSRMGIASTSFGGAIYGPPLKSEASPSTESQAKALATVPVIPGDPRARHADTLEFLNRCHALGASGIQTHINGHIPKLRARAEELGMWMEGMVSICHSTPEQLESAIQNAKAAGCTVARDGMLSGRRYETFTSLSEWNDWVERTYSIIEKALPTFEKHKFTLAIENHKDWTIDQYVKLFETYSSEYLGACLDFGNNLSLLDDPMTFVEAAAPFVKATHIKDVAVSPSENGFAMSEVPLGSGVLDVPRMLSTIWSTNPNVRFSLEMITRDPLQVPCLTDEYWVTFPDRNGVFLARMLRYVQQHRSPHGLPVIANLSAAEHSRLEEENIRACFRYARESA